MKKLLMMLLLFLLTLFVLPREPVVLPELLNPDSITLDHNRIYIGEGTSVYIYGLKDFKLKAKFGNAGEGPREFRLNVMNGVEELVFDVQTPEIVVSSLGKVSFFAKDGTYKREQRCVGQPRDIKVLGAGFAAQGGLTLENGSAYRAVNIYGSDMKPLREVFKVKHHYQRNEGLKLFQAPTRFETHDNKLFVAWEPGFKIRVFDAAGKPLFIIEREYQKVKVTPEHQQMVIDYFKTSPRYKEFFEMLRPQLKFPAHFPALMDMLTADGKVYAVTHKKVKGGFECYVYSTAGEFLEKIVLPLKDMFDGVTNPYTVKGGKFYQLVETEAGDWELRIAKMEPAM